MQTKNSKKLMIIILSIFLIIFVITIFKNCCWYLDNKNTNDQLNKIEEKIKIDNIEDSQKTIKIKQEKLEKINISYKILKMFFNNVDNNKKVKKYIEAEVPYYSIIKDNLIDVDINKLKTLNEDSMGWIQIKDANISFPFVQSKNNTFYLNHSFDKSKNKVGWIFLDSRNDKYELSKHNILYVNGRLSNTKFRNFRKILYSGWMKQDTNHVIKISRESENSLWQVFSVYHIKNNDYKKVLFKNDKEFIKFYEALLIRSEYNFKTNVNKYDKILTISSNYNDKEFLLIHAKLIKYQEK